MGVYRRGRAWYIDYYVDDQRIREKVGPSKREAIDYLGKIKALIREHRYWDVKKGTTLTFKELSSWYLGLDKVKAKKSYNRDVEHVRKLNRHFGSIVVSNITPTMAEAYIAKRQEESSKLGRKYNFATINREVACAKTVFYKAIRDGKVDTNPFARIGKLTETKRDRVLSDDEFERLQQCSSPHLRPINQMAYETGMRLGEILGLKWAQVDLKKSRIKLPPEKTKTKEGRVIPLMESLQKTLESIKIRPIHGFVFTRNGKPLKEIREAFNGACERAGIEDFRFHDLRHMAITNMRRAGVNDIVRMAITGHKTYEAHLRYHSVEDSDLEDAKKIMDKNMVTEWSQEGEQRRGSKKVAHGNKQESLRKSGLPEW